AEIGLGQPGPGPGGGEVTLLVTAAHDVVGVEPALVVDVVVAGEERNHHQTLHRHRQLAPDQAGQEGGLPVEGESASFQLLVVLQFHLEETHHLDGEAGRPGDRHRRVVVGGENLLDVAVGDQVT